MDTLKRKPATQPRPSHGPMDTSTRKQTTQPGRSHGPMEAFSLILGEKKYVPQTGQWVRASRFFPDFALTQDMVAVSRSSEYVNPAVELEIFEDDTFVRRCFVFPDFPSQHKKSEDPKREIEYDYRLSRNFEKTSIAEIRVARDPAVPLVFAGFCMLAMGTFLSCYLTHRRAWVLVRRTDDQITLHLGARDDKNRLDGQRELDRCAATILAATATEEDA